MRLRFARPAIVCAFSCLAGLVFAASASSRNVGRSLSASPGATAAQVRLRESVVMPQYISGDHALFHSLYTGEEDRIVAKTKYGNITARDLFIWLIERDGAVKPYTLESYDKAKTAIERGVLAGALKPEINEYVFTNFIVPEIMGNKPCDENAAWKAYAYLMPGYHMAYILDVIKPQISILPADRIKYLNEHKPDITQPAKWRVRYIFMGSDSNDSMEAQDNVEGKMNDLREKILAGQITFADAARQNSQAPSAANGGEIPPFKKGELFFFMEAAASNLQPGETSAVFHGPKGFYMVQLIDVIPEEEPSLDNSGQALKVDQGLMLQVLKAQFEYETKDLYDRRPASNYYLNWDLLRDCDLIGKLCDLRITKAQFRDLYPAIEADNFRLQPKLIEGYARSLMGRAAMAQELRDLGLDNDPMLLRAKWMAENMTRRDGFVERLYSELNLNEGVVRSFWREHPELFTPLAMKRIVKVTVSPANQAVGAETAVTELQNVLTAVGTVAEAPVQAQTVSTDPSLTATTMHADGVPGGGAAPTPPAGGDRTEIANVAPQKLGVYAPDSAHPANANWHSPLALPVSVSTCPPPKEEPLGVVKRLPPPLANPSYIFSRVKSTELRALVERYQSSDFTMKYEDLGFMYVLDRPEIPKTVDAIPTGSFSIPVQTGDDAVSYYVEQARTISKPPFDDIKTRAYDTYRNVEVDKHLQKIFRESIVEAGIEYQFDKP